MMPVKKQKDSSKATELKTDTERFLVLFGAIVVLLLLIVLFRFLANFSLDKHF